MEQSGQRDPSRRHTSHFGQVHAACVDLGVATPSVLVVPVGDREGLAARRRCRLVVWARFSWSQGLDRRPLTPENEEITELAAHDEPGILATATEFYIALYGSILELGRRCIGIATATSEPSVRGRALRRSFRVLASSLLSWASAPVRTLVSTLKSHAADGRFDRVRLALRCAAFSRRVLTGSRRRSLQVASTAVVSSGRQSLGWARGIPSDSASDVCSSRRLSVRPIGEPRIGRIGEPVPRANRSRPDQSPSSADDATVDASPFSRPAAVPERERADRRVEGWVSAVGR